MNIDLSILSVEICDANGTPFPNNGPVTGAYIIPFTPVPLGTSGSILVKIVCVMLPPGPMSGQILYRLQLINTNDFRLLLGNDGSEVRYIRQVNSGDEIFLPLEIAKLNAITLAAPLRIQVRDTDPKPASQPIRTVSFTG